MNLHRMREEWLEEHKPEIYMTMIETAEIVSKRYYITREKQAEDALVSQQRTAAGQKAGRFDAEIVPRPTTTVVGDRASGETRSEAERRSESEGHRAHAALEGVA